MQSIFNVYHLSYYDLSCAIKRISIEHISNCFCYPVDIFCNYFNLQLNAKKVPGLIKR